MISKGEHAVLFLESVIKIIWIAVRTGMVKVKAVAEANISFIYRARLRSEKQGHAFQLWYVIFYFIILT